MQDFLLKVSLGLKKSPKHIEIGYKEEGVIMYALQNIQKVIESAFD